MTRRPKAGKVGRWDDSFDSGGKIPKIKNVKNIKPSSQWNDPPPKPQFDDLTGLACTAAGKFELINPLFGGVGRKPGEVVTYEASQYFNYKIAWSRFEKARAIVPSYVKEKGKNTYVLGFCTTNKSSGFWEVTVSFGNGTYVKLTNPNLTIPCPSPFYADDLVGVDTDADSLVWEQIQGRITIINPSNGDGSLNPVIAIIGNRTPQDPPILIKVSLPDDPDIFDILAIDTTITERFKNIATYSLIKYDPQYMVKGGDLTPYRIFPDGTEQNYIVSLEKSTWTVPNTSYKDDYLGVILEQNKTGVWEQSQLVSKNDIQSIDLELFTHYRIVTFYGKHSTEDWRVVSDTIYLLSFSPRGIVIDERPVKNITCNNKLSSSFTVSPFNVIIRSETEQLNNINCDNKLVSNFVVTPFSVIVRSEAEQLGSFSCDNKLKSTFKTDPLGGIIIG